MELRQLRYFVAIAEHGTFSKAASKVHIAQSALSHQLAQLEGELGATLFLRSRRGVTLTEAGALFHVHALSILRQVADAQASVSSLIKAPSGRVIFGLPHSISHALALPLIAAVRQGLPQVNLELTEELTGNLARQLQAGSLHLSILFDDGQLDDFLYESLVSERMSLIYAATEQGRQSDQPRASISFREALGKPLILPANPHGVRPIIEEAASKAGLQLPNVIADISSISILRNSLLAGLGQTILPVMPLKAEIEAGLLRSLPIRAPEVTRTVALCRARHIPVSAAAEAVSAVAKRVMRDLCEKKIWTDARFIG
ncbi:LysR substrate-binding domain-containing protein [Zwartia sp.]|uniref:LysR family transcriptional regulator n=1 Tax=Zwartia sp. TaxID=2978004 RepID=UPI002725D954|nr:LysR substrate-binding domain-containing protein [Zwartia sp.]MDO9026001.1 LysR substrate-binding domain-containing protein [Zwartia sp.]